MARLVELLRRTAVELNCEKYLDHCVTMARNPSAAQRQLDLMAELNDPAEVVRRLVRRGAHHGAANHVILREAWRPKDLALVT